MPFWPLPLPAGVDAATLRARIAHPKLVTWSIELGIGGQQPHPATETFNHRYGDCKDKVTLLSAMLKEIGVDSYL